MILINCLDTFQITGFGVFWVNDLNYCLEYLNGFLIQYRLPSVSLCGDSLCFKARTIIWLSKISFNGWKVYDLLSKYSYIRKLARLNVWIKNYWLNKALDHKWKRKWFAALTFLFLKSQCFEHLRYLSAGGILGISLISCPKNDSCYY